MTRVVAMDRVEAMRTANVVWLRELFLKMSPNPKVYPSTLQPSCSTAWF